MKCCDKGWGAAHLVLVAVAGPLGVGTESGRGVGWEGIPGERIHVLQVMRLDRERAASSRDDGAAPEVGREQGCVQGGRHEDQLQGQWGDAP